MPFIFEARLNRQTVRATIGDVRAWTLDDARTEPNRTAPTANQDRPRRRPAPRRATMTRMRKHCACGMAKAGDSPASRLRSVKGPAGRRTDGSTGTTTERRRLRQNERQLWMSTQFRPEEQPTRSPAALQHFCAMFCNLFCNFQCSPLASSDTCTHRTHGGRCVRLSGSWLRSAVGLPRMQEC